jgi:hypothetical protein
MQMDAVVVSLFDYCESLAAVVGETLVILGAIRTTEEGIKKGLWEKQCYILEEFEDRRRRSRASPVGLKFTLSLRWQ